MKKLKALIPLDGSSFSAQVLPAVWRQLDPAHYRLGVVRVAPLPPKFTSPLQTSVVRETDLSDLRNGSDGANPSSPPSSASDVWERARAELKNDLADECQALEAAGFELSLTVRFGDPAEEIVDLAEAEGYDLIVMATHGRSGMRRVLMGSVAEKVLRHTPVPVLMIRPTGKALRVT